VDLEHILNQKFSRSLECSRQRYYFTFWEGNAFDEKWPFNINQSLFPVNFQASECRLLPWNDSGHSCDYKALCEYGYALSLFESSHSFSFWLFLPPQCVLNIQIGNYYVDGVTIVVSSDTEYYFGKEKSVSIANRWIHMVLTKTDSQRYYQIWIDGQYVLKINQYYLYCNEMQDDSSYINMVLLHKFEYKSLGASSQARIAGLSAFTRCLTLVEIRAIHQQQRSIDQVKVGTYISKGLFKYYVSHFLAILTPPPP